MRRFIGFSIAALSAQMAALPTVASANDSFTCWASGSGVLATATADYWTKERMEKAFPEPEQSPGDLVPFDLEGQTGLADAERAPIDAAPYQFGGKLFYTRDGNDYTASAQFAADDNIVIGAAHSVWKGGKAATHIRFVQGYSNGGGTGYDIDLVAVLTAWTRVSTDPPSMSRSQFDYATMRTTAPSAVGRYDLGVVGVDVPVTVTGYPARLEDGAYMYRETATILLKAGDSYEAVPHPMYGGGASGGAWFTGDSEPFTAVGVVSSGASDGVYGPAFTRDTSDMVLYVKGGCK